MDPITTTTTDFWVNSPLGVYLAPLLKIFAIIVLAIYLLRVGSRLITSNDSPGFAATVFKGIIPTAALVAILFAPATFLPSLVSIANGAVRAVIATFEQATSNPTLPLTTPTDPTTSTPTTPTDPTTSTPTTPTDPTTSTPTTSVGEVTSTPGDTPATP